MTLKLVELFSLARIMDTILFKNVGGCLLSEDSLPHRNTCSNLIVKLGLIGLKLKLLGVSGQVF